MKRKPIRIDWDDLESAVDDPNQEQNYYLDVVDGHVLLEGEGEEGDYDDDGDDYASAPAAETAAGTRVYVDQLTTETKLEWIHAFIAEGEDLEPSFVEAIERALDSDDPAPAVIDALRESPDAKDRWYRYRSDRLHEWIERWLEDREIEAINPPPWR
ncbi:MAG TPA: UPF0158 family protein [Candidatus Polarisedimenticolaceae bacterium]|nr:UPF0158 family protein [Candidatus Polarisedimenticolaceae bacterium]